MSMLITSGPVFRNPPWVLGPEVLLAHEMEDVQNWGQKAHKISEVWPDSEGEGFLLGIADSGKPNHPDLNDQILYSKNFSSSFTVEDLNGHATHVSGLAAAKKNNQGVVGVGPKIQLAEAKVLGDDGSGDGLSIARGLAWLGEIGCHAINASFGGAPDRNIIRACEDLHNAGIFIFCAAGNSGPRPNTVGCPACLPFTITIAAYNKMGQISRFSSRGSEIHVAMPGEDILSCWLNGAYRKISGTSMATPFFAGLAGLALSYQWSLMEQGATVENPIKTNEDLIAHIKKAAVDKGPAGRDPSWGWGVVDTEKFMKVNGHVPQPGGDDEPVPLPENEFSLFWDTVRVRYPYKFEGRDAALIYIP